MSRASNGFSAPNFPKLTPRQGRALSRDEVIAHQRARLIAVMIGSVGNRGYAATKVRELSAKAQVSASAPFKVFGTKEDYFLATYDVVVHLATRRVREAYLAESEWQLKLDKGVQVFVEYVRREPAAARLALIEALGAGATALRRMDRANRSFERMIRASFAASPEAVQLPPLVAKGIVGGIARVVRQRLLEDRVDDLVASADELLDWILTHHVRTVSALPPAPTRRTRGREPGLTLSFLDTDDARIRMMRSAAYIVAHHGYEELTREGIIRRAGTSLGDFVSMFPNGLQECYLKAYDFLGTEVATSAAEAAYDSEDWSQAVCAGLSALLSTLATDQVFSRTAFVDVFSAGPEGITRRSKLIQSFRDLLLSRAPESQRPSELTAEAIVGAVWELAHLYITRDAASLLPQLLPHAAYFVLAPTIGADAAVEYVLTTPQLTASPAG